MHKRACQWQERVVVVLCEQLFWLTERTSWPEVYWGRAACRVFFFFFCQLRLPNCLETVIMLVLQQYHNNCSTYLWPFLWGHLKASPHVEVKKSGIISVNQWNIEVNVNKTQTLLTNKKANFGYNVTTLIQILCTLSTLISLFLCPPIGYLLSCVLLCHRVASHVSSRSFIVLTNPNCFIILLYCDEQTRHIFKCT